MTPEEKAKILRDAIDAEIRKPGIQEMMQVYKGFQLIEPVPFAMMPDFAEGVFVHTTSSGAGMAQ